MIVKELQAEPYNPILLYKPQGTTDSKLSMISKDGFIFALQTEFQRDLYRQYASTVICIDSTHKTNAYDFKLVTLLVVDEYGEGIYKSLVKLESRYPHPSYNKAWRRGKRGATTYCIIILYFTCR